MAIISTRRLVDVLKEQGFELPANCREVRLIMGYDSALMIQYDCYLAGDELQKLGRALTSLGDEQKWSKHG